jgi:hypothetical protein
VNSVFVVIETTSEEYVGDTVRVLAVFSTEAKADAYEKALRPTQKHNEDAEVHEFGLDEPEKEVES